MILQATQPPSTTLTIVLGASKWPKASNLSAPPSFPKSASAFVDYLLSKEGFQLPFENLLNLFDTDDSPSEIVESVSAFLKDRKEALRGQNLEPSALIFYYVGHGSFSGKDYILALRNTNKNHEGATSLRMVDLAEAVQSTVSQIRRYIILDCCFAAAAYDQFQAAPLTAAVERTTDVFPRQGTALLCASGARDPAKAPPAEVYTMFSAALLKVLNEGNISAPPILSLRDVGQLATDLVRDKYADEAVRPEVHTPEMREGDIALIPLFPNAALRVDIPARLTSIESRLATLERVHRELKNSNEGLEKRFQGLRATAVVESGTELNSTQETEFQLRERMPQTIRVALYRWYRAKFWGRIWVVVCSTSLFATAYWAFYLRFFTQEPLLMLIDRIATACVPVLGIYLITVLFGRAPTKYTSQPGLVAVVRLRMMFIPSYTHPRPALPEDSVGSDREPWTKLPEVAHMSTGSIVDLFTIPFESVYFYIGNAELGLQFLILFVLAVYRIFPSSR